MLRELGVVGLSIVLTFFTLIVLPVLLIKGGVYLWPF